MTKKSDTSIKVIYVTPCLWLYCIQMNTRQNMFFFMSVHKNIDRVYLPWPVEPLIIIF